MTTEREEFEAYVSNNGRWPRSIDRNGESYRLIQTQSAWDTWKDARAPLLETLRMKNASVALAIKTQQAVEDLLQKAEEELATAQARIAKLEQRASRDCPRCGMANQIEEMRKK